MPRGDRRGVVAIGDANGFRVAIDDLVFPPAGL